MKLHRYWITFEKTQDPYTNHFRWGIGVTAFGKDDALYLIQSKILEGRDVPPVKELIEDIDVSTLDPRHVLPNMRGNPAARGIWYPSGFDY